MDAGDSERAALQGAAGSHHRPCSHSGDRHGVIPVPTDRGKAEERSQTDLRPESRGNDGPWKAWKTKSRFSTLPTALGNRWSDFHIPTASTVSLYIRRL